MTITEQQVREAAVAVIEIVIDPDNLYGVTDAGCITLGAEDAVVERLSKLLSLASDKDFIGGKFIG
jgi:hypothetical protein